MKAAGLGMERIDDFDLGIHHAFYRTYDPVIGRMMQIDPLAEQGGMISISPYNAFLNNPILFSDPNGDFSSGSSSSTPLAPRKGEWNFFFTHNIITSVKTFLTAKHSAKVAEKNGIGLTTGRGSERNALRHTLGQALVTMNQGEEIATESGDSHENKNKNLLTERSDQVTELNETGSTIFADSRDADSFVDLLNNETGRDIGENADSKFEVIEQTAQAFGNGSLYHVNTISHEDGSETFQVVPTKLNETQVQTLTVNMLYAAGLIVEPGVKNTD